MATNFCSHEFGTIVCTNSVSADGYEVENLLGKTRTMWGQQKGFMAESFIKPPVDVTFMFRFNIWIQKIIIDPKVGGQISGAVDVFSASVPPLQQGSSHKRKQELFRDSDGSEKLNLRDQTEMQLGKDSAVFSIIGRAFSSDRNTTSFCFDNLNYQPIYPQIAGHPPQEGSRPGEVRRSLRYSQPGALTNVSHVTLRINRVISGSVAIKSVQIWGQPSRNCSKETVNWVLQVATLIQNPPRNVVSKRVKETKPPKTSRTEAGKTNNVVEGPDCPEEFIDPITTEMMMLPVLLPSGHTVDSETLSKHSKAEAVWGRPPNDPFTGIPFSQSSKPLPNVKLKERIDQYLLKAGQSITPAARDVGRSRDRTAHQDRPVPASLVSHPRSESSLSISKEKCVKTSTGSNVNTKSYMSESSNFNLIQPPSFRGSRVSGIRSKRKQVEDHSCKQFANKKRPNSSTRKDEEISHFDSSSTSTVQASTSCHEDMLSQSLDTALELALSSLPSFSRQSTQQCSKPTDDIHNTWSCSACHNTIATKDGYHVNGPLNMYKLPCTHLICRDCLLSPNQSTSNKCTVCGGTFKQSDVVKVHL